MTDWDRAYPAPAKLNLFLHVVGCRPDGYHLLQSLFRLIDRGDTLRFAPRKDGRVLRAGRLPACRRRTICVFARHDCCRRRRAANWASRLPLRSVCRWAGGWAEAVRMRPPCCWRSIASGACTGSVSASRNWACAWGRMCHFSSLAAVPSRRGWVRPCSRSICRPRGTSSLSRRRAFRQPRSLLPQI